MTVPSEKIAQYYALKPIRFSMLRRFEWRAIPLLQGQSPGLVLRFTSIPDMQAAELVMEFEEVRNLRFPSGEFAQNPLISIRDVSAQQWDGVIYEVRDLEHDSISFLCRDFSASVRQATR